MTETIYEVAKKNEDLIQLQIKLFYQEPKVFVRGLLLSIKELNEKVKDLESQIARMGGPDPYE